MITATARCLTHATAVAALLAGAWLLPAAPARAAAAGTPAMIVQLPRVVVTGSVQRTTKATMTVVQLPRVVVTGRRADRMPTELVQAPSDPLAVPPAAKQGT